MNNRGSDGEVPGVNQIANAIYLTLGAPLRKYAASSGLIICNKMRGFETTRFDLSMVSRLTQKSGKRLSTPKNAERCLQSSPKEQITLTLTFQNDSHHRRRKKMKESLSFLRDHLSKFSPKIRSWHGCRCTAVDSQWRDHNPQVADDVPTKRRRNTPIAERKSPSTITGTAARRVVLLRGSNVVRESPPLRKGTDEPVESCLACRRV